MKLCFFLATLTVVTACGAAVTRPQFRVGIELPTQVPVSPAIENALRGMGIGYINYYVKNCAEPNASELPAADVNKAMLALADKLGLDYSIACHHMDPPDDCVQEAVAHAKGSTRYRGVVFDELEHVRQLWPYSPIPLTKPDEFKTFRQAYEGTLDGYTRLGDKFEKLGSPVTATHVWPVMHHIAARAGFSVCPKICKEFFSPVSLAIGMGAARQYGRELWADCDLWFYDMIPGHNPEEFKSNLLLAYWLGVDLVYVEGAGYNLYPAGNQGMPFSLANKINDDTHQLTPHGEVLRWFCREYVPSHPRDYSFRDVKPNIAIVRFEDTCHGQRYTDFPDNLYGSPNLHSDSDTEAWLQIWNVLTSGKTGRDGLSLFKTWVAPSGYQRGVEKGAAASYASRPASADMHRFFIPMNGVVVYDETVGYDLLRDVPLIYLTGKEVSEATMAAVRKCVGEGSVCVAWGPLAARHGYPDWKEGVKVVSEGKGKMILTDDFGLGAVVREVNHLIGHPDKISYRFGDHQVALKRATDNEITVTIDK